MTRLLDEYYDPAVEVDTAMTEEEKVRQATKRLESDLAVARVAAGIPRRVNEGTREELALDKRRSRRIAHALSQCLLIWGGKEREPTKEEQQAGAQVDWPRWLEERRPLMLAELRQVATWAKKTDNLRFGKSAVVRLKQELEWLEYAMRD